MTRTPRPTGITVLAILHFVIAAMLVPSGGLWILVAGLLADPEFSNQALEVPMPPALRAQYALLLQHGVAVGLALIIFGLLKVVSGVGLWKLRNWGRRLTIALAALAVALSLPSLVSALLARDVFSLLVGLSFAVGYGAILWYLFWPEVKRVFGVA